MPRVKWNLRRLVEFHKRITGELEQLKLRVYIAAMSNDQETVDRLRKAIRTYEHDISVFENQLLDFEPIGDSTYGG